LIDIDVDIETKRIVWDFLSTNNVGNRSKANGSKEEQYVGLLGEVKVKQLLNIDTELINGFDGGFDLEYKNKRIDVKTMGRTVDVKPYYVNNFISYQKDFDCDIYIFCSLNKKTSNLTVCGWVTKNELLERSKFYEEGTVRTRTNQTTFILKAPTYEIQNNKLNHINTLL
jgi:hypothetical protein